MIWFGGHDPFPDRMAEMATADYTPEDDVPDDWRPFDSRKWSREELLAEIDALNEEVAKWVGIATERKGAASERDRYRKAIIAALACPLSEEARILLLEALDG